MKITDYDLEKIAEGIYEKVIGSEFLLPCPFCGNTNLTLSKQHSDEQGMLRYNIHCTLGCGISSNMFNTSIEEAITRWNTRIDTSELYDKILNDVKLKVKESFIKSFMSELDE